MKVYLDLCCLKRPFDDQSQFRVHLETEAIIALRQASPDRVDFLHCRAHDLENAQNQVLLRALRVALWLSSIPLAITNESAIQKRTGDFVSMGFAAFDAVHLASAESAGADVFVTCDDRLLKRAARIKKKLYVRVVDPITLSQELFL